MKHPKRQLASIGQSVFWRQLQDLMVGDGGFCKCRLINPAKLEIEIISKHYLDFINNEIREKTQMNQWHNTKSVLEWFKAIKNKTKSSFINFDIVEFYPSISKELLSKAIKYAQSLTTLEEKVIKTIYHARKSLLFDKDNIWVKKDNAEFDVTMRSYDSAELCELVSLYLLDLITKELGKKNIGLYRDDGKHIRTWFRKST